MVLRHTRSIDRENLHQLAGVTGLGWTGSLLGFLGSVLGSGNGLVNRVVSDPQALLYVGVVLFLATLGLDRLAEGASGDAPDDGTDRPDSDAT